MTRGIAVIEVYVFGETEEQLRAEADRIAAEQRKLYDNHATVVRLVEAPYGSITSRPLAVSKPTTA